MKRRLRVLLLTLAFAAFFGDLAVSLFVVRTHWRPMPPFGALTNERQRAWLERERAELDASAAPSGLGRFDPVLGWSLRPNASSADGSAHTNSRGWRGTVEPADRAPAGVLRIVCAGDSFTFCEEVGDEDTWERQVERRMEGGAELVNLGVGGYGTDQALLRLGREYPREPVDAVLIGLLVENIGRNVNRYRPRWYPLADSPVAKPRFVEGAQTLELVEIPYASERDLLDAVASGQVLRDLASNEHWTDQYLPEALGWSGTMRLLAGRRFYAARDLGRLWRAVDEEPFRVTTRLLAAFDAFARSTEGNGARTTAVLVFPTKDELERFRATGERPWQTLLDWLANAHVPAIDLTDALALAESQRAPGDPELWGASHLSPAGNAVVARVVHGWIEGNL